MGAAYYIVLDNPEPGFDVFVNGKAIIRDAKRLSKLAKSMDTKPPEDYFAMSAEDAANLTADFDLTEDVAVPQEQWYEAEEGLAWVATLRHAIESDPTVVTNANAVLSDLARAFDHSG
jgi:hypothetical protein